MGRPHFFYHLNQFSPYHIHIGGLARERLHNLFLQKCMCKWGKPRPAHTLQSTTNPLVGVGAGSNYRKR